MSLKMSLSRPEVAEIVKPKVENSPLMAAVGLQ